MMEYLVIFIAGLMGSSHCIGMCGGFAIMISMRRQGRSVLLAQILYTIGRVSTYTLAGAIAGLTTSRLGLATASTSWLSAILGIVAGAILLVQGLSTMGFQMPWRRTASPGANSAGCLLAGGFRSILQSQGYVAPFVAGVLTGWLPCGFVYGFLALAAQTQDGLRGALTMAAFGAGTAPVMLLTGLGAASLTVASRTRLLKIAAASVVLTGVMTTIRGTQGLFASQQPPKCPLCHARELAREAASGGQKIKQSEVSKQAASTDRTNDELGRKDHSFSSTERTIERDGR